MKIKVLVLGGNGFIGRHAVACLESMGASITIGSRNPKKGTKIPQVKHRLEEEMEVEDWMDIVSKYDVILNCVGILRQRLGESYDAIHHLAPKAIASACAESNTRFVHVSAIGLSLNAKSRFLTSKYKGEQGIKRSNSDWIIARPSLLDGEGGYGAAWLRGVSKLPFFVVPRSAKGKIAPLIVEDAGEALAKLCVLSKEELNLEHSREFELGGEYLFGFEDYIKGLRRRYASSRAFCFSVPGLFARLGSHICDVFHFSPFSFGHWELLCHDNVPYKNRLPELLGRPPTKVVESEDTIGSPNQLGAK